MTDPSREPPMSCGRRITRLFLSVAALLSVASCDKPITPPSEQFGHEIGADYVLLSYNQLVDYWKKLDAESDRMTMVDIGKTAEGQAMWMAIITSPENHRQLERYRDVSRRLALAEGLTDDEARALAAEGKAVVWIDGGTHASEIVNHQTEFELAYQLVSRSDPEVVRILDEGILLTLVTNPDGMNIVADWYMGDPQNRNPWRLPELFHKYIGGDTNRDHYMSNQPETENINRVLYREWFPQIVYNEHQTGPQGTVLFIPPFRDPFNYDFDPLVIHGVDMVGAAIQGRYLAEGKAGAGSRSMANYSTWWEGCLRCNAYFHNAIGILTEISGSPTPMEITFIPENQLARTDLPLPIAPQDWHFRQAIEYILSADFAILDLAAKNREDFLFNRYLMGKHSIEKGSRDNWTFTPDRIAAVKEAMARDGAKMEPIARGGSGRDRGFPRKYYDEVLRDPAFRDARGYIIPADQPDFLTATKFVNALIKSGGSVQRATAPFEVAGRAYPEGSYVVGAAQAFRPHVRSMFEPQNHPDDFAYEGGPPIPPYDAAGWTLAYQMGVAFDKVFDAFDGPFEAIEGFAEHGTGTVTNPGAPGFLLSHQVNDAFIAVNRLLAAGEQLSWLRDGVSAGGTTYPPGTMYIPAGDSTAPRLQRLAEEVGLSFVGVDAAPSGSALRLRPVRIGLFDVYGGSEPSGWTRWLLEQFGFPYEVVYPQALDAGNIADRFDVLIFEAEAVARTLDETQEPGDESEQPDPASVPEKYRERLGRVSSERTMPQLRAFLEAGGTVIGIGSSAYLGYHAGLPLADALVDPSTGKPLPMERYWAPGSIHRIRLDNTSPLAYGLPELLDIYFDRNPVFRMTPRAGLRRVGWFDSGETLRSGWALGEQYHKDGVTVVDADVGRGKLLLLTPLVTFRGQPHASFKLLFNGIFYGHAEAAQF
ncbi:MAG: peptidase [Gemmatimonadetes bacterium]|nr:peptidase [Gemmatimonadota bacterium]